VAFQELVERNGQIFALPRVTSHSPGARFFSAVLSNAAENRVPGRRGASLAPAWPSRPLAP
jgi:hypothetical protein